MPVEPLRAFSGPAILYSMLPAVCPDNQRDKVEGVEF